MEYIDAISYSEDSYYILTEVKHVRLLKSLLIADLKAVLLLCQYFA